MWAEPNFLTKSKQQFTPDDSLYSTQWHLHNIGQNSGAVDADAAAEGWELSKGDGSTVAIFDDGVDLTHPDIPIWNNPGETGGGKETNGIDDDANGTTVTEWMLNIGSSEGANDIYDSGSLATATTDTVSGLPTDGSMVIYNIMV
ncbi:MAG: hypothetical protein QM500_08945 [Methylococcales bacterium]